MQGARCGSSYRAFSAAFASVFGSRSIAAADAGPQKRSKAAKGRKGRDQGFYLFQISRRILLSSFMPFAQSAAARSLTNQSHHSLENICLPDTNSSPFLTCLAKKYAFLPP